MKPLLIATMLTWSVISFAADSVYVTTELTRNGTTISTVSAPVISGQPLPFWSISSVPYIESYEGGKQKVTHLEIGTAGSITPFIVSDGVVRLEYEVTNTQLIKIQKIGAPGKEEDLPHTENTKFKGVTLIEYGKVSQRTSVDQGAQYVYSVSASKL